jgi:uncharacterized protein
MRASGVQRARHLARNIPAVIEERVPTAFIFQPLGTMLSLGNTRGVARVFGVRLTVSWPGGYGGRTTYSRCRDGTGACGSCSIGRWSSSFDRTSRRLSCASSGSRHLDGAWPPPSMEPDMTGTNDVQALRRQLDAGTLTWRGPTVMLFARSAWAVVAQALVAAIFALRSSPTPWRDAEPWLPVYGTLIDAGCLALLWQLTRREGVRLLDIVGFDRTRLVPDVLLGFALIPVGLVFILGGVNATGWLLYGTLTPPYLFEPLPLAAALYGVLVFPLVWGLTEQMTYNGYLVPRFQVLYGSTSRAVALVAFVWSFQHAVMPLTFDAKYMAFRLLSPVPFSFFQTLLYLRLRRLIPFAIAHAFLDGASVLIGVLIPQLRV